MVSSGIRGETLIFTNGIVDDLAKTHRSRLGGNPVGAVREPPYTPKSLLPSLYKREEFPLFGKEGPGEISKE